MRTLPIVGSLLAFSVAFAAYGCSLDVTGIMPVMTTSAGGAGPSSSTVAGPGGASGTGGEAATSTAGSVTAAGSTTGTGCIPKAEDCTNGDDDDCDGDIDCKDSDCSGTTGAFQCSPDTTGGWTVVAFDGSSGAQCPTGYGSPAVVASQPPSLGADCTCNCGSPQLNPCTQGSLAVQFGIMQCGGGIITSTVTGACDPLASTVAKNQNQDQPTAKATKLAVKATTCDASATPSDDPLINALSCTPTAAAGAGCPGQAACIPKASSGSVCIQHAGDMACPAGGPMQKHLVAAPTDIQDKRTCGACACTSTATSCSAAKFTGYDDANCTNHPVTVDIDAACHFAANGQNFTGNAYFKYTATPDTMNCAAASATTPIGGSFVVDNPITICCP
jgi:hypothetical protein